MLDPNKQGSADQEKTVETPNKARECGATAFGDARKHRGLEFQVAAFVLEDAAADGLEEFRGRGVVQGAVIGNGDDLGGDEHAEGNLDAGEDADTAENGVDPVFRETGDALGVHEPAEVGAVALLFLDEKREGLGEVRIARGGGVPAASFL
jgi:hypothetical protein